ncbi:IclR family transcriptional regulator domain-containing protein [Schnuerera ultunensis]|uniref:IclR family transcriptional regulator domain-containing protein n=1 Tax=Schnuerera ultunensis TaxID=45497 RepID=UPI0038B663E6
MAAPVFDLNGDNIASITISAPTARFTDENKRKWIKIVLQISKEATEHLKTIN